MQDSKKLINYTEVSEVLSGNRNTIRANRKNKNYSVQINELLEFLDDWVLRNSKSKDFLVTIKTKI